MSIRGQREQDARIAEKAVPEVVDGLRAGRDGLSIAQAISGDHDLDLQKAYRWVQYVEERFEAARRRAARLSAVVMWIGIAAALAGGGLLVAAYYGFRTPLAIPILLLVAGLPTAIYGAIRGFSARRRVQLSPRDLDIA